jgi:hypothetical protein
LTCGDEKGAPSLRIDANIAPVDVWKPEEPSLFLLRSTPSAFPGVPARGYIS